jgi:hypothetical protein
MKLEIQAIGNPKFPRYVIVKDTGEVFDGTGWNKDRKKAVVYVNGQELAVQFRSLEETMHNHLPKREFWVTLNIMVRADGEYTREELASYLESAVAILLDHAKGTGPIPDSLAQLSVTWTNMREKGVPKDQDKR